MIVHAWVKARVFQGLVLGWKGAALMTMCLIPPCARLWEACLGVASRHPLGL